MILDNDLYLHVDIQGPLDFHKLKSALAPYYRDEPFFIGLYTLKKKPVIEYINEFEGELTEKEIETTKFVKNKVENLFIRKEKP